MFRYQAKINFCRRKKLREEIAEVYTAVSAHEAAPSNLQVQRVSVLQSEVKKKDEENKQILKKYDSTVMDGLRKEGLIQRPGDKKPF